ncbi:MAG TPA: hypothetical protein PL110_03950 [Candidatus Eremiobacteraeota bacterium]|nr:hypothetical protein [Candidatus Eremiobacteraeota bacterium]
MTEDTGEKKGLNTDMIMVYLAIVKRRWFDSGANTGVRPYTSHECLKQSMGSI